MNKKKYRIYLDVGYGRGCYVGAWEWHSKATEKETLEHFLWLMKGLLKRDRRRFLEFFALPLTHQMYAFDLKPKDLTITSRCILIFGGDMEIHLHDYKKLPNFEEASICSKPTWEAIRIFEPEYL